MGAARLIMCAAEVPFFQMSGKILKTLGCQNLNLAPDLNRHPSPACPTAPNPMLLMTAGIYGTLGLVGGAYTVRFVCYSLLSSPW